MGGDEEIGIDKEVKILFWNVAGVFNKDREFWKYIKKYDFISLCETWIEEGSWNNLKKRMPDTHIWNCSFAKRDKKRGRAKGGFIIGRRREWGEEDNELGVEREEGMLVSKIKGRKKREDFIILSVYNTGKINGIEETVKKVMEEERECNIIIGGDFNVRIGEKGGIEDAGEQMRRSSKDKAINNGGRQFLKLIGEIGGYILNGTVSGDKEGEYTYVGPKGSSVIDYVVVNEVCNEIVKEMKVEERIESDHLPLALVLEYNRERRTKNEEDEDKMERRIRICWDEKAREEYKESTMKNSWTEGQEARTIEEKWKKLKDIIEVALVKKEIKTRKRELGDRDWWDRMCTRGKRKVKRILRKWRKGKVSREKYMEERRKWKELLETKQKKRKEEEEKELRGLKNEAEVWKYINKRRGRKEDKGNNIKKEEWKNYFQDLLEGSEEEEKKGREEKDEEEKQREGRVRWEEELEEEEICRAVRKMKKGKAAGTDGIPMEAWLYGSYTIREGLVDLFKQIWKEGRFPKEWRRSVVMPIYKKGDKEKAENYRGISLLCTAYKIYAEILKGRLEVEAEERKLIPESQAGFRKGRGTMDNILILNHIVQRERCKEDSKVYTVFVDLKAAFDNVNRVKLWSLLERNKISEALIERLKELYKDTEITVWTKKGLTEAFKTTKGVRQGCVLSPLLFNLYIAELDMYMRERALGGIKIGNQRIWSLAYADDMVLVAKNREALKEMLSVLKRFLKDRDLVLNVEKTKVLVFNRKKKEKREKWKWGNKEVEEVQNFKYLGFIFNRKADYGDHIKELAGKGRLAANMVWGLGERICRDDFGRRWMLYRYLVNSVMSYGVEIWGWEEKGELEKVMLDYIRWVFKLDFCTPRYLITREFGVEKQKIRWGIRARKFEEKIKNMEENRWVKICWEEKERIGWKEQYGIEREKYYNRNGWGIEAQEVRGGDGGLAEELVIREIDLQRQREEGKIREAKYNKRYKEIILEGSKIKYWERVGELNREGGRGIRALARARCGNMEEENKYWLPSLERRCGLCKEGKDNLDHFIKECTIAKEWFQNLGMNEEERFKRIWKEIGEGKKVNALKKLWVEKEKAKKGREGSRGRDGVGVRSNREDE